MTASQIVERLENMGCALWLENGNVRFKDSGRVLTPAVLQTLQRGKADVVKVLEGRREPFSGPATGWLAELVELGRLSDIETKIFSVMGYDPGSSVIGPWVGQQEILRRMAGEMEADVLNVLAALEEAGRAMAFRRYQSNTLWRILPLKGLPSHITPPNGYKPVSGESFTDWDTTEEVFA